MTMKSDRDALDVIQDLTRDFFGRSGWQPKVDIYRRVDGLLVKVELAGVEEQDFRVSINDHTLTIEGKRRDWTISDIESPLSMEITYDWFKRVIPLPQPVHIDNIQTDYRDGMLLIYLVFDEDKKP